MNTSSMVIADRSYCRSEVIGILRNMPPYPFYQDVSILPLLTLGSNPISHLLQALLMDALSSRFR